MNREIKFRAKRVDLNYWIHGYLREVFGETKRTFVIAPANKFESDGYTDMEEDYVQPDTIGQFTGLHDKNGREIYEGDILMCIGKREDNKAHKYYRKVLFKNGAFGMTVSEYKCINPLCNHIVNCELYWEVVGNIYDNPELLEE